LPLRSVISFHFIFFFFWKSGVRKMTWAVISRLLHTVAGQYPGSVCPQASYPKQLSGSELNLASQNLLKNVNRTGLAQVLTSPM
jgi:hypothetical protein